MRACGASSWAPRQALHRRGPPRSLKEKPREELQLALDGPRIPLGVYAVYAQTVQQGLVLFLGSFVLFGAKITHG